jgi:pimeloyl-ACP methyl ester carboxylesterase
MPHTENGSPRIYFETLGDPAHPPLVLIEGLGAQMIGWPQGFLDRLVDRGLYVITLDNRDVGLSGMMGEPGDVAVAYTLSDMAGDVCRVLDTLGLAAAHIAGQSMGGAIAQTLAIDTPARVLSLTLIYTAAVFDASVITEEALGRKDLVPPANLTREEAIASYVDSQRPCASTNVPFDEARAAEVGGRSFDRAFRPDGIVRQTSAVLNSPDRRPALAAVTVPTAIIHGRADRLIRDEASIAMAAIMKDAELHLYPGMGHVVSAPLWDDFATIIERTVRRA